MPSKAKPKAAKRPSRAVGEKPAATKPKGAAGNGGRSKLGSAKVERGKGRPKKKA